MRGDVLKTYYLDTSALLKGFFQEKETLEYRRFLDDALCCGDALIISRLTYTEFYCVLKRCLPQDSRWEQAARDTLANFEVYPLEESDYLMAAHSSWRLRGADALHLAAAVRLNCDAMLVFDQELAVAAQVAGLEVPQF
ncbi:type II toxin-antitoxin system VapC family toxin [Mobiluncus mulieris]|uniref:Ribonuclease VapC n=1 Tax=Mobiluncus mulieris TaxID=2052 RepID=A0A7Y0U1U6_9ACTO|nr:type II toxin-antitoxin system VapC family toxin [Mobiluncus mulieris]